MEPAEVVAEAGRHRRLARRRHHLAQGLGQAEAGIGRPGRPFAEQPAGGVANPGPRAAGAPIDAEEKLRGHPRAGLPPPAVRSLCISPL